MSRKDRVLSRTNNKTIVQHGELVRILNVEEIQQWNSIISKIEQFDEKEMARKGNTCSHKNIEHYNHGYHAYCKDCKEELR